MADEDALRNSFHDSGVSVAKSNDATFEEAKEKDNCLPVVFQCSQCNSILGDSLSWFGANPVMRTISIKSTDHYVECSRVVTSKQHTLACDSYCNTEFVMQVKTKVKTGVMTLKTEGGQDSWKHSNEGWLIRLSDVTSKVDVHEAVNMSTAGTDAGSTYNNLLCVVCKEELGKKYLASPPNLDALRGLFTFNVDKLSSYQVGSTKQSARDPLDLSDIVSLSSPIRMQQHIHKLDLLIVSIDRRLQAIENFLSKEGSDAVESSSETGCTVETDHNSMAPQNGHADISSEIETDTDLFNHRPSVRQENGKPGRIVTHTSPQKTTVDGYDVTCLPVKDSNTGDIRARTQSRGTPQHASSEILQRGSLVQKDSMERVGGHQRYSKSSKHHLSQDGRGIQEEQDMEIPTHRSKRKRLISDSL